MRAIRLEMRNLLTGTSKPVDHEWPCTKHDHVTRNCATCQALIEMVLR